jgi:hypothetical protein
MLALTPIMAPPTDPSVRATAPSIRPYAPTIRSIGADHISCAENATPTPKLFIECGKQRGLFRPPFHVP